MGTANSKTTIDTDTHTLSHTQEKKRKSNPSTTLKMVIKPQEERTREECRKKDLEKQTENRASFVSQWYLIHLPVLETWVRSLVQEVPHVLEQLTPCVTTIDPVLWSPGAKTTDSVLCCSVAPVVSDSLQPQAL